MTDKKDESLGQAFDHSTNQDFFDQEVQHALGNIAISLGAYKGNSGGEFSPQFKINADDKIGSNLPEVNRRLCTKHLKKIRFLSIERGGVRHDFPIRIEKPTGLRALLNRESPVIFVKGLDGKEHSFQIVKSKSANNYFDGANDLVEFLTDELAEKYNKVHPPKPIRFHSGHSPLHF